MAQHSLWESDCWEDGSRISWGRKVVLEMPAWLGIWDASPGSPHCRELAVSSFFIHSCRMIEPQTPWVVYTLVPPPGLLPTTPPWAWRAHDIRQPGVVKRTWDWESRPLSPIPSLSTAQ